MLPNTLAAVTSVESWDQQAWPRKYTGIRSWTRILTCASNILVLPFRRTHSVSLSEPIKQYISNKYDQHPSMFNDDLAEIDKIRASAVNCLEPHASGIKKLQAYAAQLVWMAGKFPIDVSRCQYPPHSKSCARGGLPVLDRSRLHLVSCFGLQYWDCRLVIRLD